MELLELEISREIHPVDVIEQVAHNNDWSFERAGDDEISISVVGSWTDYHVSFSWMEDFEALHLACAFDIKVPETRALEVMRLLSLINEQMLFGHFDLWEQEGAIMFRQSLLLAGGDVFGDPAGHLLPAGSLPGFERTELPAVAPADGEIDVTRGVGNAFKVDGGVVKLVA